MSPPLSFFAIQCHAPFSFTFLYFFYLVHSPSFSFLLFFISPFLASHHTYTCFSLLPITFPPSLRHIRLSALLPSLPHSSSHRDAKPPILAKIPILVQNDASVVAFFIPSLCPSERLRSRPSLGRERMGRVLRCLVRVVGKKEKAETVV